MKFSLCFALLATTAAALQAPTSTRTQQRRVVANRAPMDVLAPTSTALCAGADDDYTAPKIEFDPDAPTGGRDLYRTTVWNSTTVILSSAGTLPEIPRHRTEAGAGTTSRRARGRRVTFDSRAGGATGRTASTSAAWPSECCCRCSSSSSGHEWVRLCAASRGIWGLVRLFATFNKSRLRAL